MYRQKVFAIDDIADIHDIIERCAVAQVISVNAGVLTSSMVPLLLDRERGPFGTLVGHFARANDQWKDVDPTVEGLAIFTGPDAYVSPSHYATKTESGKVVPTWNYVVVQAHGPLIVRDDAAFVEDVVRGLTARHEAMRDPQWSVDDAPPEYVAGMLRAIVGFEIEITRLEGTAKLSQNRSAADIEGVIAGLSDGVATERAVADEMRARGLTAPAD